MKIPVISSKNFKKNKIAAGSIIPHGKI